MRTRRPGEPRCARCGDSQWDTVIWKHMTRSETADVVCCLIPDGELKSKESER